MKRFLLMAVMALIALQGFAVTDKNAVTMVSFEQRYNDYQSTIALRNNTSEQIHNVAFLIRYLDMKGNDLDYQEYKYDIEIAPGMTKKLNLPAYEHSRSYHYYKNAVPSYYDSPAFDIRFQFKGYNLTSGKAAKAADEAAERVVVSSAVEEHLSSLSEEETDNMFKDFDDWLTHCARNYSWFPFAVVLIWIFTMLIYILMIFLVAQMARRRRRNIIFWLIMSLIFTPLLIMIILLCIGTDYNDTTPRPDGFSYTVHQSFTTHNQDQHTSAQNPNGRNRWK